MGGIPTEQDIEGDALALIRRAGFDDDETPHPAAVAECTLGLGSVRAVHAHALPGVAALARVYGQPRIFVRVRADVSLQRWAIAHELGHLVLGIDAPEPVADRFAACLVMPRRAFVAAVRIVGADWQELAARFVCSQSAVALRYGELIQQPLVLVTPRSVRVRGEPWGWPSSDALRRIARKQMPGLARATLTDDARRVVLRSA